MVYGDQLVKLLIRSLACADFRWRVCGWAASGGDVARAVMPALHEIKPSRGLPLKRYEPAATSRGLLARQSANFANEVNWGACDVFPWVMLRLDGGGPDRAR